MRGPLVEELAQGDQAEFGVTSRPIEVRLRSYVNEYCTSLEMAGASLTLLRVDAELKELLLAPAEGSIRVF